MPFDHYLQQPNDEKYFSKRSLAYYYEKMEGFAAKVENSAKTLNLTKEEVERQLIQRLAEWDEKLQDFPASVETLLAEWTVNGTIDQVIQTALIDEKIAPVTELLTDIAVNVKSLGAKGDGVTDDTQAIQNAYNNLKIGEKLLIPHGTYNVNGLVFDKDDTHIEVLGILKQTETTGTVLQIGSSEKTTFRLNVSGVLKIERPVDWGMETTGLKLLNLSESHLIVNITGFDRGLVLSGDGTGTVYNNIHIMRMNNNRISIDMEVSNNGWVNENKFFGGRFAWGSGLVYRIQGETLQDTFNRLQNIHVRIPDVSMNNNIFFSPSLEGGGGKFIHCNGQYNTFYSPRLEGDAIKIHWGSESIYNQIMHPFGNVEQDDRFISDSGASRNKMYGRDRLQLPETRIVASNLKVKGDLRQNPLWKAEGGGLIDAQPTYTSTDKALVIRDVTGMETFSVDGLGRSKTRTLDLQGLVDEETVINIKNSSGATWTMIDGSGQVKGVLKQVRSLTLPNASAGRRGMIQIKEGTTGVADETYICVKNASDGYEWKRIDL